MHSNPLPLLAQTKTQRRALALLVCLLSMLTLVQPQSADAQEQLWTDGTETTGLSDSDPVLFGSFADLAELVAPAVVNIEVSIPYRDRFDSTTEMVGQGSGFIVHEDGYVITNNHVIEGATEIRVTLHNSRELLAELVGTDERTDIALIRLIGAEDLPVAPLGNSGELRVGEWVMAIGSPFGLEQTVTVGIVSALNRRGIEPSGRVLDEEFIQTDTPINPGNSGGPLIDIHGNVIGVNAAVRTGNNIGFAIPINVVKMLIPQLERGVVERSWLGVSLADMTDDRAETLGLTRTHGALVSRVLDGSPAANAGLVENDVIIEFNGEPVDDYGELRWLASIAGIGEEVDMVVIREGEQLEVSVVMGVMPGTVVARNTVPDIEVAGIDVLGMRVAALDDDIVQTLQLDVSEGLIVLSVDEGSAAARNGVAPGDIIIDVGGQAVASVDDFEEGTSALDDGDLVRLRLRRGPALVFVAFFL